MREDGLFAPIYWKISKPKEQEGRKNTWISEYMWGIVDTRVSARQDNARNQGLIRRLRRQIAAVEGGTEVAGRNRQRQD